jgi:hypothetical protein
MYQKKKTPANVGGIPYKKPRKPRGTKETYFTKATEKYLKEYTEEDDITRKNIIFFKHLYKPLLRLVEGLIHTFKFYRTDNEDLELLKNEVISFFLEKMHNYNPDKGKAYSYFNMIGRNYLIIKQNTNTKKIQITEDILTADTSELVQVNQNHEQVVSHIYDFIEIFIVKADEKIPQLYSKVNEQKIAYSIIELFRNRDNIEIFNKKALYLYIREMTDENTLTISKVVKTLKKYYVKEYEKYNKHNINTLN